MTVYRYMPAGYEGSNLTGDQAAVRVGRGEIVLCNQCSTLSVRVYHDAAAAGSPARAGRDSRRHVQLVRPRRRHRRGPGQGRASVEGQAMGTAIRLIMRLCCRELIMLLLVTLAIVFTWTPGSGNPSRTEVTALWLVIAIPYVFWLRRRG
jgi:hypothetical protein